MSDMTFHEYLHKVAHAGDNPRGDFIHDARDDSNIAPMRTSYELLRYLERVAAWDIKDTVLTAAKTVWRDYQRYLKRQENKRRPELDRDPAVTDPAAEFL